MIQFLNENKEWVRPLWIALGLIGMFILRRNRPEFYEGHSVAWWIGATISYIMMGPALFLVSLVTFIKFKNVTENDREADI